METIQLPENFIHIGGRQAINPDDVIMLKADINYTTLYFIDGSKSFVATTLKTLEGRLVPHHFYRTHKSFLVNLQCIKCYYDHSNSLQMSNNQRVMVSRRKKLRLKEYLGEA